MSNVLLVTGGRVFDLDGDIHRPAVADILVIDGRIAAVRKGIAADLDNGAGVPELAGRTIDQRLEATDKLVIPGFVNGHYHSHDVLLKGCFETIPLELWVMSALPPAFPKRSKAELRARTLLGAAECLRSGITTVQDLATVFPYDPEDVDTILEAYDEIGIRCVFALQIADVPGAKCIPFWEELVPAAERAALMGAVEPFKSDRPLIDVVEDLVTSRRGRHRRITWALGPSSPERCSEELLRNLAAFSTRDRLPVYTHIYESKAMTLIARQTHEKDGGSLINYLNRCGLLTPRTSLAHSVWMTNSEIDAIAARGTNVVLNPVGNLKTKSGVPPIRRYMATEVNTALGCDNCSCSDCQNMFQAMKLFCSLAAIEDPDPGRPFADDAIRAATLGGARTAGLEGEVGALKPGMAADFSVIDLSDPSFIPFNSAARQLVFTEPGRSVETVVVGGEIIVSNRRIVSIDERALREEVAELIGPLLRDLDGVQARLSTIMPYLEEAASRTWRTDIGLNRYIAG